MTNTTPQPHAPSTPVAPPSKVAGESGSAWSWNQMVTAFRGLDRRSCAIIALRAARRVAIVHTHGACLADCLAAELRFEFHVGLGHSSATSAATEAAKVASDGAAPYYAQAAYAVNNAAHAATHTALPSAPDEAHDWAPFWELVSLDFARLKQLQSAQPPLTGWDDPRLGPLWPEGAPEWHKQLEREIAEMRAKLDARPDPFAPPIPDETRRKLDDHRKLNELGDQGAFKDCRGQYVFVYNGEFVGHGTELGEARRQAAEKLGVPPSSLVYRYVY